MKPTTETAPPDERWPLILTPSANESEADGDFAKDTFTEVSGGENTSHLPRILAVMLCFFIVGISVTAIGAFEMDIAESYQITHQQTAMIFPAGVIGYCISATQTPMFQARFGWRGIAMTAPLLQMSASLIIASFPRFNIVLIAYFFNGLGTGLSDVGFCTWASKLPSANVVQGLMHGSFSIGCVLAPMVTVIMIQNMLKWYQFYWVLFGLIGLEWALLMFAFQQVPRTIGVESAGHKWKEARMLIAFVSLFYFVYVAVESCYTNWFITYVKQVRHFSPAEAALSSSIFWTGLAIGRIVLGPVTEYLGVWKAVSGYIVLSLSCQVIFRICQDVTGALIALGSTGFSLAAIFPSGIVVIGKNLPMEAAMSAVSIAVSLGQVGGALAPLAVGMMADRVGMTHLPDVILTLTAILLLIWVVFPRVVSNSVPQV